jgi:hypothetical protein
VTPEPLEPETSASTSVQVNVTLPAGDLPKEVSFKLNGQPYGEATLEELSPDGPTTMPVILWGSGTMTLDVYVDGELYETQTVNFD